MANKHWGWLVATTLVSGADDSASPEHAKGEAMRDAFCDCAIEAPCSSVGEEVHDPIGGRSRCVDKVGIHTLGEGRDSTGKHGVSTKKTE